MVRKQEVNESLLVGNALLPCTENKHFSDQNVNANEGKDSFGALFALGVDQSDAICQLEPVRFPPPAVKDIFCCPLNVCFCLLRMGCGSMDYRQQAQQMDLRTGSMSASSQIITDSDNLNVYEQVRLPDSATAAPT